MAEICALLRDEARLLTLIGAGGVGKTRLALRVAEEIAPEFPDGIVFVGLASVADPTLLLPTIARAFAVREGGDRSVLARLSAVVGDRRPLLVLDNLEHLTARVTDLADLLGACSRLTILATSRIVLRLTGEQVYQVPPLSLSEKSGARSEENGDPSCHSSLPAPHSEAVALFVQRARAADACFALTPEAVATVGEIVRRLDGLPLAIELAAARVRSLPSDVLLSRLNDQLSLLTGGARDLPDRQRTMRDTIAWSHDLLIPSEQAGFRRLAVFSGGFTLAAAEAVGEEETPATVDLVAALVDQSLLQRGEDATGQPRYLMLETVREYGLERLMACGEESAVRSAHAAYFTGWAEAIAPFLPWRTDTAESVALLDADLDNLRAALAWSAEYGPLPTFLRLAVALESYWRVRGRLLEGQSWLDRALAVRAAAPGPLSAAVVRAAGWIARSQGDFARAEPLAAQGLALSREHGDTLAVVHALTLLGFVADEQGQPARARAFHEEALALGRGLTDPAWSAWSMRNIGAQAFMSGELEAAERWVEEALSLFDQGGYRYGAAVAKGNLASVVLQRGEHARAAALFRDWLGQTWDAWGLRHCLEGLAEVAVACGEMERAARLLGAAESNRARLGVALVPKQYPLVERDVAEARHALGAAAFAAAWDEGRRLSPDEARVEAFHVLEAIAGATEPVPPTGEADHRLTPRELEVLRLVAAGRSNQEIAETLFIGTATVRTHLTNAFAKLEVGSRTAAVAVARRLGIV